MNNRDPGEQRLVPGGSSGVLQADASGGASLVIALPTLLRRHGGGNETVAHLFLGRPAPEGFASRWIFTRDGLREVGCDPVTPALDAPTHWTRAAYHRLAARGGRHAQAAAAVASSTLRRITRRPILRHHGPLPGALLGRPVVALALGAEAALASRRLGWRYVYSVHNKGGGSRETAMALPTSARPVVESLRRAESEAAVSASAVVFPSRGALDLFREWHPGCEKALGEAEVIYNGIPDPGAGDPEPQHRRSLINIAAHVPEKQVELFVRAAGLFMDAASAEDQYEAENYGALDPVAGGITARLRHRAAAAQVRFGGFAPHEETLAALRRCWVFITCPALAIFDLCLLEAMAIGRPIVATPVGGNVEALGEDYPFYASTDQEIRDRLIQLRGTPGLWAALSARNRARFLANFTLSTMEQRYGAVLSRLAGWAGGVDRRFPEDGAVS